MHARVTVQARADLLQGRERAAAGSGQAEHAPAASAPRRRARDHRRSQQAFCLQSIEHRVDGAERYRTPSLALEYLLHRNAVGLVVETMHRQEHELLERTEL